MQLQASQVEEDKKTKVQGVLIRCEGDNNIHIKQKGTWERYLEAMVEKTHPIGDKKPTIASTIMGLPVPMHKLPHNPAWDKKDITRFDNQPAGFLNLNINPRTNGQFEFAPPEWQSGVGSVRIVR